MMLSRRLIRAGSILLLTMLAAAARADWVTTTVGVGNTPEAVAINPVTNKIYIANEGGTTVTVVDGATNNVDATVTVGATPIALAVNPATNKIYVVNSGSGNVSVINGATNGVDATVTLTGMPNAVAVNPVTNKIYVANGGGSTSIAEINGADNSVTMVTVGNNPWALAVNSVTDKIYVANYLSGTVSVVNGATHSVSTVTVGSNPRSVAANPVTNKIYVANASSGTVTVIDGATQGTLTVSTGPGSFPWSVAVNQATNKIYVANSGNGTATAIDGVTNGTTTVTAGTAPNAVAVNPVTNKIYVANMTSSGTRVTVIDGATNTPTQLTTAGADPYALAVNPVTNKVYVANKSGADVTVIDGTSNSTAAVTVGSTTYTVVVNPVTNRIYAACYITQDVFDIDGATNVPTRIGLNTGPVALAVNPVTNKIYAACYMGHEVVVIDGATRATTSVPVFGTPYALAVNVVTNQIYVANQGDSSVVVIDGATNGTTRIVVGQFLRSIAVNPSSNRVYVGSITDTAFVIEGATGEVTKLRLAPFHSAIAVNPVTNKIYVTSDFGDTVNVIDGATNNVTFAHAGTEPVALAVNPVTNKIYVANYQSNDVSVIDGASLTQEVIATGNCPSGVAVDPVRNKIYVTNKDPYATGTVAVIDGATNAMTLVPTGTWYPQAIAANPVTGRVYAAHWGAVFPVTVITPVGDTWDTKVRAVINRLPGDSTSSARPALSGKGVVRWAPPVGHDSILGVYHRLNTAQQGMAKAILSLTANPDSVLWSYNWIFDSLVPGENMVCVEPLEIDAATANNEGMGTPLTGNLLVYPLYRVSMPPAAVHDIGVAQIVAPGSAVDSGVPVTPACSTHNYGTVAESYQVRMKVGSFYERYVQVDNHAPQTSICVTFPADSLWPRGQDWPVTCSTELSGDDSSANDCQTGSVDVNVRDVGPVSVGPASVDSGSYVTPTVTVHNYGTLSPLFAARLTIPGLAYDQTVLLPGPLSPDTDTLLNFPTSLVRAVNRLGYAFRCTTLLYGDIVPGNNLLTGAIGVNVRDVGCTRLIAPVGSVDSGTTIVPACSVYNWGSAPETYRVRMKIGSFYNETTQVATHLPEVRRYVTFPGYAQWPRGGPYPVTCTTELGGDLSTANDAQTGQLTVNVLNAEAVSIDIPAGPVDSGALFYPAATVCNLGTGPVSFPVVFRAPGSYASTQNVSGLTPDKDTTIVFTDQWQVPGRGSLVLTCSTKLSGDAVPGDNWQSATVVGTVRDAELVSINVPSGHVDSGAIIQPQVTVRNNGAAAATFVVACHIGDWTSTPGTITALAPGLTQDVTFDDWQVPGRGVYPMTCTTKLANDMVTGNDWKNYNIISLVHDAAAEQITAPAGIIMPGLVTPQARVRNYGTEREPVDVTFMISSGYIQTLSLPGGLPLAGDTLLDFTPEWDAQPGDYVARCSIYLAGDQYPPNDTVGLAFHVGALDVGALRVVAPVGEVDSAAAVVPSAWVKNYGDFVATFATYFAIYDVNGFIIYVQSAASDGLAPGETALVLFDTWPKPHDLGSYTTRALTVLLGDANPGNDAADDSFRIVLPPAPPSANWHEMTTLPIGLKRKKVKAGAAVAWAPKNDSGGYVYAVKGNNSREFYGYDIAGNSWQTLESLPATPPGGFKKKSVKKGSVLVAGPDSSLYAAKGGTTVEFWRYSPVSRGWEARSSVPLGQKALREGAGAVAVEQENGNFIYLLKGSGTAEFYRYDISGDRWETMAGAPLTNGKGFKNGSCLAYNQDTDTIYALKGTYNKFYAYSVAGNEWFTRESLPWFKAGSTRKKKVKDGAALSYHDGTVYALKGGNTQEFWTYLCDSHQWREDEDVPLTGSGGLSKRVKAGGALAYASTAGGDMLFAFKGNNTLEFWRYGPLDSAPGARPAAGGNVASGAPAPLTAYSLTVAPNPFTSSAVVLYALPKPGRISIRLYDVTGSLVTTLAQGYTATGRYTSLIDAARLARGIYVLKFDAEGYRTTRKLILE